MTYKFGQFHNYWPQVQNSFHKVEKLSDLETKDFENFSQNKGLNFCLYILLSML